ncbi:MAG: FecR domain-containing protein, partial [Thermoanaerobaculia bacterium]
RTVPVTAPVVASVELLTGAVHAGGVELALGGELVAGALVETTGWAGGLPAGTALRLDGGQSLRLAADTRVRLVSARLFELERGTLYVDSDPNAAAGGVEVVTSLGTVRDIGTQFEVRLSEGAAAIRVRVREGECSLEAVGESYLAARGEQLSLHGDGSVLHAEIEPYSAEWDWVIATAPGIEIEGRSLGSFLDWVSREMGREVRYMDPQLAEAVRGIRLSGSTASFTPDEALASVLAASNLGHRVENGSILVTRAR